MRITNSAHESVAVASHIARFRNSATGRLHREPNTANGSLTLKPRGEHGQVVAFQLVKTAALCLVLVEPFSTNDGRQRPWSNISFSPISGRAFFKEGIHALLLVRSREGHPNCLSFEFHTRIQRRLIRGEHR